jgi:EAL domain-containing protein (putative c-di-GMP-specific phosphodiesterase class I)
MPPRFEVLCLGLDPSTLGNGDLPLLPGVDLELEITVASDRDGVRVAFSTEQAPRWDLVICSAAAFYDLGLDEYLTAAPGLVASLVLIRAPSSALSPSDAARRGAADVVTLGDREHLDAVIDRELAGSTTRKALLAQQARPHKTIRALVAAGVEETAQSEQADGAAPAQSPEDEAEEREDQHIKALIEGGGLTLEYQPIVPLRHNGSRAAKFEALLRLRDDNGDLLQPGRFFPIARKHQWLSRLDVWVFRKGLSVLTQIQQESSPQTSLFLNLGLEALTTPKAADAIIDMIRDAKISRGTLTIELRKEALALENDATARLRTLLKNYGHGMLMEQYSAQDMDLLESRAEWITHVKLDPSVIRAIAGDADEKRDAKAAVALARDKGIKTIALAVENAELLPNLYALGIDYVQGNFVSVPHEELIYPDELGG